VRSVVKSAEARERSAISRYVIPHKGEPGATVA
jgi:hypothetical protein